MSELADIRAQVAAAAQIRDIVLAMRSLAAARARRAAAALDGARGYTETIARGLAAALALLPEAQHLHTRSGGRTLIAFGSEHGFVGALNDRVVGAVAAAARPADRVVLVGTRAARVAAERGVPVAATVPMASGLDGVAGLTDALRDRVYEHLGGGDWAQIPAVDLIFARRDGGGGGVELRRLLPLDLAQLASAPGHPPLCHLEPAELLWRLTAEHFYAALAHAVLEAFAAENWARLETTHAAQENIERRLEELRSRERAVRQDEITTELMDVVAGSGQ